MRTCNLISRADAVREALRFYQDARETVRKCREAEDNFGTLAFECQKESFRWMAMVLMALPAADTDVGGKDNNVPTKEQNGPLTQADLDVMDYDKVWIDYGDDGEWALVVSGRIYALAVLEGAGFGDILRDEVDGETMDRPSGNYTVYRCPPEAKDNNVPTNEPLTIEELREMDGEPVWAEDVKHWALIDIEKGGQWDGVPFAIWAENGMKFTYNIKNRGLHCYRRPPEGEEDA